MTAQELIKQLISDTEQRIELSQKKLTNLSVEALHYKENATEWNALECLDHLHHYANFYHDEITKRLTVQARVDSSEYKESWLGKQFMKIFDEKKAKKYKTMAHMKPDRNKLSSDYVMRFIEEQIYFLDLLKKAENYSLDKNKIPLEFFKIISLPLGDLFRFLNAHDQRHLIQAINISCKYIK